MGVANDILRHCEKLHMLYLRWKDIYFNGSFDPTLSDGNRLNQIRNDIWLQRKYLEYYCKDNVFIYPDEYFWPDPPKIDWDYQAVDKHVYSKGGDREIHATYPKPFDITW